MADENEEIIEENDEEAEVARAGALFSPEGITMMLIAVPLDIFGFILTVISILTLFGVLTLEIPEIINWISDGMGLFFFGLWSLFKSSVDQKPSSAADLAQNVVQRRRGIQATFKKARGMGKGLKFGLTTLGEFIPIFGALPLWTLFVWSELKR